MFKTIALTREQIIQSAIAVLMLSTCFSTQAGDHLLQNLGEGRLILAQSHPITSDTTATRVHISIHQPEQVSHVVLTCSDTARVTHVAGNDADRFFVMGRFDGELHTGLGVVQAPANGGIFYLILDADGVVTAPVVLYDLHPNHPLSVFVNRYGEFEIMGHQMSQQPSPSPNLAEWIIDEQGYFLEQIQPLDLEAPENESQVIQDEENEEDPIG